MTDALAPAYRIERELGGGGMSRVFLAEETRLGRRVVIKVLPAEMSLGIPADRFEREVRVAASLQHPHLVPVLNAGAAGDVVYYVMPWIEGDSLAARIARDGALPLDDAIRILRDVLDALAYAHARGVVHRDIKPDNILLSGRHALVTDFGVAKAVRAAVEGAGGTMLTSTGVALGTPAYMAPEQAAADPRVDHRADLYAVGVVAYEMLAGRPPFTAPTAQAMLAAQVAMTPDPVDRFRPGIPADLVALVMRSLQKIPGDRPQSAEEMLGRLDAVRPMTPASGMTSSPTVATPAVPVAAAPRLPRVLGLFALAAVGLTAAAYGISRVAGLPDWAWVGVLACMLIGLPIVLYTSRLERRRAELRATGEHSISAEHPHHRWFTWRRALSGGAAALGAVVLLSGAYVFSRKLGIGPAATLLSAGTLGAEDRLVLADFENRTSDSTLGAAVTEALRVDLGQSRAVRLLDSREVKAGLQRMGARADTALDESLARNLAVREGAKAVVAGDVSRLGSGYVLTARIVTADSGATLAPVRVTAENDAHLITAVNHLSADLRERIGESLRTIRATEPLEKVTTASLPALRLYTEGTRAFDAGRFRSARDLLLRATETDTAFAMAWRKLAALYFNMGSSRSLQLAAATEAFNHRDRLPPLERSLTEGFYYTNADLRDPRKAIDAYRVALEVAPGDPTAVNNLGLMLNVVGQFAAAESLLRQGMASRPSITIADNLVDALAEQSKWGALDTVFQEADRASAPGHPGRVVIRLSAAFAQRDYVRAESLVAANEVRQAGALPVPPVSASRISLDMFHGRYGRAARLAREIADSTLAGGDRGTAAYAAIVSTELASELGRIADARQELAAALAGPAFRNISDADLPLPELGRMHALLGDAAAVRRDLKALEALQPRMSWRPGDSSRWVGLEAQAEHRWQEAAAAFAASSNVRPACSPCGAFYAAQMWEAAGEPDSAIVYYRRGTDRPAISHNDEDALLYPLALRRLGDLYEQKGDRKAAVDWYGRFVDLWHDADPDLQPIVRDIRDRLSRLTAEPRAP